MIKMFSLFVGGFVSGCAINQYHANIEFEQLKRVYKDIESTDHQWSLLVCRENLKLKEQIKQLSSKSD